MRNEQLIRAQQINTPLAVTDSVDVLLLSFHSTFDRDNGRRTAVDPPFTHTSGHVTELKHIQSQFITSWIQICLQKFTAVTNTSIKFKILHMRTAACCKTDVLPQGLCLVFCTNLRMLCRKSRQRYWWTTAPSAVQWYNREILIIQTPSGQRMIKCVHVTDRQTAREAVWRSWRVWLFVMFAHVFCVWVFVCSWEVVHVLAAGVSVGTAPRASALTYIWLLLLTEHPSSVFVPDQPTVTYDTACFVLTCLTQICSKNVLLTFPLGYEHIISECSLNVQNIQFIKYFKNIYSWLCEH